MAEEIVNSVSYGLHGLCPHLVYKDASCAMNNAMEG
jgi:hypothetical protein